MIESTSDHQHAAWEICVVRALAMLLLMSDRGGGITFLLIAECAATGC